MASWDQTLSPTDLESIAIEQHDQVTDNAIACRLTFRTDPDLLNDDAVPRCKRTRKLARKDCEKLRRDRLNAYIGELAKIVPLVMQSKRKIDKASILRLTVSYLRIYHGLTASAKKNRWSKSDFILCDNLANLLLDSLGGFLLVINAKGILIFATDAISKHLGHSLADVLGLPVYDIVHREDHEILKQQLSLSDGEQSADDVENNRDAEELSLRGQRSFYVRMENNLDPTKASYEIVRLVGHLRMMPCWNNSTPNEAIKRKPELCLIAIATIESSKPITELCPVLDDIPNQWITRHELDGKITFSDQRGACLTGFLPSESRGLSAYSLVHPDDIEYIVVLHNHFLAAGELPKSVFRMLTKSREVLYVSNSTHLVVDMWTKKPKYIISMNEVLEPGFGQESLEAQQQAVMAMIGAARSATAAVTDGESQDDDDENSSSASECGSTLTADVHVDKSLVNVVVGSQTFTVDISSSQAFDADEVVRQTGSGASLVFDPHASADDGGSTVPLVKPVFLDCECPDSPDGSAVTRSRLSSDGEVSMDTRPASVSSTSCPWSCLSDLTSTESGVTSSRTSVSEVDVDMTPTRNGLQLGGCMEETPVCDIGFESSEIGRLSCDCYDFWTGESLQAKRQTDAAVGQQQQTVEVGGTVHGEHYQLLRQLLEAKKPVVLDSPEYCPNLQASLRTDASVQVVKTNSGRSEFLSQPAGARQHPSDT